MLQLDKISLFWLKGPLFPITGAKKEKKMIINFTIRKTDTLGKNITIYINITKYITININIYQFLINIYTV